MSFIRNYLPELSAVALPFAVELYFLPSKSAEKRGHPNEAAIFALNLLLGWTFVGWSIAWIWVLTESRLAPLTGKDKARFMSTRFPISSFLVILSCIAACLFLAYRVVYIHDAMWGYIFLAPIFSFAPLLALFCFRDRLPLIVYDLCEAVEQALAQAQAAQIGSAPCNERLLELQTKLATASHALQRGDFQVDGRDMCVVEICRSVWMCLTGLRLPMSYQDRQKQDWKEVIGHAEELRTKLNVLLLGSADPATALNPAQGGQHAQAAASRKQGNPRPQIGVWLTAAGCVLLPVLGIAGWWLLSSFGSAVLTVAISPDGKRIVSGGTDKVIRVYSAETGQEVLQLQGHTAKIYSVAVSADGTRIVSGGEDRTVKVWDARTGRETLSLTGHSATVHSVKFSTDGKRIISGSADHTVKVWNAQTGQETLTLTDHNGPVLSVAFSPNGKWIVSGGQDRTVKVWDADGGRELLSLKGHTSWISSVAVSPDGKRIASGSDDKTVRVWDAENGQGLLVLKGHTQAVESVAFSPDGGRIASGSKDKTVRVWSAGTGKELLCLKGHTWEVWGVAFSPDGKRLVSGGVDCAVRVWDVAQAQEVLKIKNGWGPLFPQLDPDMFGGEKAETDGRVRDWQVYKLAEGRFSIQCPCPPREEPARRAKDGTTVRCWIIKPSAGVGCCIVCADYPASEFNRAIIEIERKGGLTTLEELQKDFMKFTQDADWQDSMTVIEEKEIHFGRTRIPGRCYVLDCNCGVFGRRVNEAVAHRRVMLLFDRYRLYRIQVQGPPEAVHSRDGDRYFDSFEIQS